MKKWLLAAVVLCVMTAGCGTIANRENSPSPAENQRLRANQTNNGAEKKLDSAQSAKRLEDLASRVEGVKSAHCVVAGNKAVVGINVGESVDRSRVGTIKYEVAQALRKDPLGVNAVVTADMDINRRLTELGENIRAGKPIQGFVEEMADLTGRIMPQLPGKVLPKPEVGKTPMPTSSPARPMPAGMSR
ncbi:YhcN/YlaJ family sporulation lipoprotein [Paenibacillus herberti]|uniref:Sporulation protein n=1 Tax=Paenibacillus herberti TaxID=1619309 RepID=A0A229P074_9BACL|nr:YhcN/YlaJ family sporulation lipoprotein [Paenibacillus herberti]OXM15642.1 sporulation protein [Paenibacillus herberti]